MTSSLYSGGLRWSMAALGECAGGGYAAAAARRELGYDISKALSLLGKRRPQDGGRSV